MDTLLKALPVGMFFRGIFPGGFFLLAFVVASGGWEVLRDYRGDKLLQVWLPFAAFAGMIVYTLHRSCLYPFIEAGLDSLDRCRNKKGKYRELRRLILDQTCNEMIWRWTVAGEVSKHISIWADYAHLQYASFLCIVLGAISGRAINTENFWSGCSADGLLWLLALVFLISALFSDLRLHSVIYRIREIDKEEKAKTTADAEADAQRDDPSLSPADLIAAYERGIDELRAAVDGLTPDQLRLRPVPGEWSTLEVVCHIADCEQFFADRMKRTLGMERPLLIGADGSRYPESLGYHQHDLIEELDLVAITRRQMARILRLTSAEAWQRTAVHTETGLVTVRQLLHHATNHLRHHLKFVAKKRAAIKAG